MYRIKCLNKISPVGTGRFGEGRAEEADDIVPPGIFQQRFENDGERGVRRG